MNNEMLHFKSCSKCTTGTIEHNFDAHGNYLQCLNCGFMRDVPDGTTSKTVKRMLAAWHKEMHSDEPAESEAIA